MSQIKTFQQKFLAHQMERLKNILNHVQRKYTLPDFTLIAPYIYLQRIQDFQPSSFIYLQDPVLIFVIALKIISNIDIKCPDIKRFYSIQSSFVMCLDYKFD